jgi:hypothetical protein
VGILPPSFLLQIIETLENNAFPVGETVSNIGKMLTRITGRQMKVSPCKVYPEFLLSVAVVHGEVPGSGSDRGNAKSGTVASRSR